MTKDVVATYIAEQAPEKRVLLDKLRVVIAKAVPDAAPAIKWGVPVYAMGGKNVCALATFKDYVAINFFVSPDKLADPNKKLEGAGKTSRMLKVHTAKDIDAVSIQRWLKAASAASQ